MNDKEHEVFGNFIRSFHYYDAEAYNNFMIKHKDLVENELIAKSAELSLSYAKNKNSRFELGEDILSKNAEKSYYYSRDVLLGDRFEKGEKEICKNPKIAYLYARDIIKARWPEAEKNILGHTKSESTVISYAIEVVKGRWEEAEETIKNSRNDHIIFEYCTKARKEKWEEVEDFILRSSTDKIISYAENSVKGRWISGEKKLLETTKFKSKIEYCKKVLKGRWKEFEDILFAKESPEALFHYAKDIMGGKLPEVLHNKMIVLAMTKKDDKFIKKYFKAKKYKIEKENKLIIYRTNLEEENNQNLVISEAS